MWKMNSDYEFNGSKLQRILDFVDSDEANDRIFALDILGQLLSDIYESNFNLLSNVLEIITIPTVFAILTRCDDISPFVRTKALTVLSQNMKYVLDFLIETKNQGTFVCEDSDVHEINLNMNGDNRFFWYCLRSFEDRWNEFQAILRRRTDDESITVRKAALLAFENLLVFNATCITEENLKCLECSSKDISVLVQKQSIRSMNVILKFHPGNSLVQEYWLKCILPLIQDSEDSVQAKALSELEVQFLRNIFSSTCSKKMHSLKMLKILSSDDFLIYHRFFKMAFNLWKSADKLKSEMLVSFLSFVGTEWEGCIWFYVSCFVRFCPVPSVFINIGVGLLEKFQMTEGYSPFTEHILKVVECMFQNPDFEILNILQSVTYDSLNAFSVPGELIPMYIKFLFKAHQCNGTPSLFELLSGAVIQKCRTYLSDFNAKTTVLESPSEELVTKCFCVIKELCQLCPTNITPRVISPLLTFTACVQTPVPVSDTLKAHAYAALGQISLQNEVLARELLPGFTKELLLSEDDALRNNVSIILINLCKRYPHFADRCIPLVSLCFKDKYYLIRYQTIKLLVKLLQEGYIRCKGPLFFAFLSTLVDGSTAIREMGQYTFHHLLPEKKNNFSDYFVESIFVFNNFVPPDKGAAAESLRYLHRFSIPGENNRGRRMTIYSFLLEFMNFKERASLIKPICEILTSVAESVYPLSTETECIVRDCFAILTCPEIRNISNLRSGDVAEEEEESEVFEDDMDIKMAVVVGPVIPAVISLKNFVTNPGSDLMLDIILFVKDFLRDFKYNLKNILADDRVLLRQLELEMKNDAERVRRQVKARKALEDKSSQTVITNSEEEEFSGATQQEEIQTRTNERDGDLEQGGGAKERSRKTENVAQERQKQPRYNLRPLASRMLRNASMIISQN